MNAHKVKATENTLRSVKMAIEEFATLDPLANIYDPKVGAKTFGAYPPYMLDNWLNVPEFSSVQRVLEPYTDNPLSASYVLANRLHRDLSGPQFGNSNVRWYVSRTLDPPAHPADNDIRALYTYLKVFAPDTLTQLPKDAVKPLSTRSEYVNPTGGGTDPGSNGLVDVLGIYDAWGVPLNYLLYVKLEWAMDPATGGGVWVVADRLPVVMSRGISREEYDAEASGTDALDPQKYIFSDPLPSPAAGGLPTSGTYAVLRSDGILQPNNGPPPLAGWARAKAAFEDYDYLP
jgi:hypothetical protein